VKEREEEVAEEEEETGEAKRSQKLLKLLRPGDQREGRRQ
jgi:hypothetical protein